MSARLAFRWCVFLLAAFYCLRTLVAGPWDGPGGPFRYLTVWALFASLFAASRMLARERGRTARRWDGWVGMTAVLNAMVVFLYWRLYLDDPASVTRGGRAAAWWLDWYLHGLGPALQWIDAVLVHRSPRRPLRSAGLLAGLVAAYAAWIEFFVRPANATPSGLVASGLPYPFLNDMTQAARLAYYAANGALALVLLAVFAGLAALVRRRLPPPAGRAARCDSRDG